MNGNTVMSAYSITADLGIGYAVKSYPDDSADVSGVTAVAGDVLAGKVIVDASGAEIAGTMANNGAANASISTVAQEVTIEQGYHNGNGKIKIDTDEQAKIIPGNIKSGVTVLGVTGTLATAASVKIQEAKSVTPTKSAQSITPDSGYDALAGVNVGAIPDNYANVDGVTAAAGDVLSGKVIVTSDGSETAGTMANNGAIAQTINGTTVTSYTVPAGYHSGAGKVSLDNTIETALAAI